MIFKTKFKIYGKFNFLYNIEITQEISSVNPIINHSPYTEWLISFTNYGKCENRMLQGENEDVVKERFLSCRPNARINNIVCLNCG